MKAIEFFNYSTKRGYKVGMQSVPTNLKLDEQLAQEGYNLKKTTKLYLSLWHPWLPRKVSAMLWLIIAEGLPVEARRTNIGLPRECKVCQWVGEEIRAPFFDNREEKTNKQTTPPEIATPNLKH